MGAINVADDILQVFREGRVDAKTLSDFMSKKANETIDRRLAPSIRPFQYYLDYWDTVPTIINDAINNTAVDGGVLADTFVTVTANGLGAIARNQRDKNSETLSIKDFGAKGDGTTDDTQALIDAVNTGLLVNIPAGTYKIRATEHPLTSNLFLKGHGEVIFQIEYTTKSGVFSFTNSTGDIDVRGISFKSNVSNTLAFIWDMYHLDKVIDSFVVTGNSFDNVSLLHCYATEEVNPAVSLFGIKHVQIYKNKIKNINRNFFSCINLPLPDVVVHDNSVENFDGVFVYSSIGNNAVFEEFLYFNNNAHVHNNRIHNTDDYWGDKSATYYNVVLFRGNRLIYENNDVSGMKTRLSKSLTDVYSMALDLIQRNNKFYNFGCFDYTDISNPSGYTLLMAKNTTERITARTKDYIPVKTFIGNTYKHEDVWLKNIGMESKPPFYEIANTGIYDSVAFDSGGHITIKDNTFELCAILGSKRNIAHSLQVTGNTFNISKLADNYILSYAAYNQKSSATVTNNKVFVDDAELFPDQSSSTFFTGGNVPDYSIWNSLVFSDNHFESINPLKRVIGVSLTKSLSSVFSRNTQVNSPNTFLAPALDGSYMGSENIYLIPHTDSSSSVLNTNLRTIGIGELQTTYLARIENYAGIRVRLDVGSGTTMRGTVMYKNIYEISNSNGDAVVEISYKVTYGEGTAVLEYLDATETPQQYDLINQVSPQAISIKNLEVVSDTGAVSSAQREPSVSLTNYADGRVLILVDFLLGTASNAKPYSNIKHTVSSKMVE